MKNWSCRSLLVMWTLVVTTLAASHSAFATYGGPPAAPEIDPGLIIPGLAAAGAAAALVWEKMRR